MNGNAAFLWYASVFVFAGCFVRKRNHTHGAAPIIVVVAWMYLYAALATDMKRCIHEGNTSGAIRHMLNGVIHVYWCFLYFGSGAPSATVCLLFILLMGFRLATDAPRTAWRYVYAPYLVWCTLAFIYTLRTHGH